MVAYLRKNRTSELSQFLGASAAPPPSRVLRVQRAFYTLRVHVCVSVYLERRENHGKAKNTFRINCRAGIPRRCAEQNAATMFVACKARAGREKEEGRSVPTGRRRVRSVS